MSGTVYHVAYASCGCVRAIRILGVFEKADAEWQREFPDGQQTREWPRIKCAAHLRHGPSATADCISPTDLQEPA